MENSEDGKSRKTRRAPRPATPERLEKAAYHYLERFATSAENLRRVLMRKVDRSAQLHGTDRAEGRAAIDALVDKFLRLGLLDDATYARGRAASLHRQGKGARAIRMALLQKGIGEDDAAAALEALVEEAGTQETDLAAALAYARRRRLGPYRGGAPDEAARAERRDRDLAALARRGFSYDVCRTVIEAESPEALEDRLADGG
ncbi:MAG: RecX family transcriptional regulator [Marivibrio sp.]|uniref:regulatory protein RecX n=1 Tax=Marivibrio sp. TaxID=2039719 RepID=UPI0032EEF4ED